MADRRWRNSPYGRVIHEDVMPEDMPKDADLMIRSIKAYWDHAVEGAYPGDLTKSRIHSAKICDRMWRLGWIDKYPEAARRAVQINQFVLGDRKTALACMVYWCEHKLLTADIVTLNRIFSYYLDDKDGLNGPWEKVLDWCRRRVEHDRIHGGEPVGLVLLRQYLRIREFARERQPGEEMHAFLVRMNQIYNYKVITYHQLIWKDAQRNSDLVRMGGDTMDPPSEQDKRLFRSHAAKGSLLILAYVLREDWVWDGAEEKAKWQDLWDTECICLEQEMASFDMDWYDKEVEKAKQFLEKAHKYAEICREGRGLYLAGLAKYALQDETGAIALMRQAWEKKSSEAKGWLNRHGIDYLEEKCSKPLAQLYDVEKLADELYRNPNTDGYGQLEKILREGTELASPQPEAAAQMRQAMRSARTEAEILDIIFADGRHQAKQTIGQLADKAAKDPKVAEKAQWYVLLAFLHLAKLERQVALHMALEFIQVDQGNDEEIHTLVLKAKEDNVDAMYSLCIWYHEDERRGRNPYLSAVVYHLGRYLCQAYRKYYFRIQEVETREAMLDVWIDVALRMGEDGDLEPIRIGLYQGDPLCGSLLENESLVQRLGLPWDQVVAHLYNAWECGYDVDEVLYEARKKDKELYTEGYLLRYNRNLAEARNRAREKMEQLDRIMTGASRSGERRGYYGNLWME